jgi:hypothetical protein
VNEKQKIELATANGFLALYNTEHGTSFSVDELSDSPDVICVDTHGNRLGLEITLTEDCPGDIQAALGRSDHLNLENLGATRTARHLQGNVSESLLLRLRSKLQKRYGVGTALVIRNASGVDWDWDTHLDEIRRTIGGQHNHFDCGVWLINRQMDQLYKVL